MFDRYNAIREARALGDEAGFTLIELLIVIVVLAILAAVVIFGLSGITGQSAVSACNADAKTVEIAVESYHAQQGSWPNTSAQTPTGNSQLTSGNTTGTTVAGPNNIRYLRTFPSNPNHYVISLAANGEVDVVPDNGSGTPVVITGGTSPYNYDGTATLTGPNGNTSTNPCTFVS